MGTKERRGAKGMRRYRRARTEGERGRRRARDGGHSMWVKDRESAAEALNGISCVCVSFRRMPQASNRTISRSIKRGASRGAAGREASGAREPPSSDVWATNHHTSDDVALQRDNGRGCWVLIQGGHPTPDPRLVIGRSFTCWRRERGGMGEVARVLPIPGRVCNILIHLVNVSLQVSL